MSIINVKFFKTIQRKYLNSYMLNTVRELEKFLSERNRWGDYPDVVYILAKLLCGRNGLIITDELYTAVESKVFESQFYTLNDLEIFYGECIKQTHMFASGQTASKPKIVLENEEMNVKNVHITHFLNASTKTELLDGLKQIQNLAKRLDEHLKQASVPRQQILVNIFRPAITPLLVIIENIYEVLIDETHKA